MSTVKPHLSPQALTAVKHWIDCEREFNADDMTDDEALAINAVELLLQWYEVDRAQYLEDLKELARRDVKEAGGIRPGLLDILQERMDRPAYDRFIREIGMEPVPAGDSPWGQGEST